MSTNYKATEMEELTAMAVALGLVAVFPQPNELQLDLDNGNHLNADVWRILETNDLKPLCKLYTESKTKFHNHCHIWLPKPILGMQRAVLQACLGSDPKREAVAAIYLSSPFTYTYCCFEKPEAVTLIEGIRFKVQFNARFEEVTKNEPF